MKNFFLTLVISILLSSCASRKIKDIPYKNPDEPSRAEANLLNVFTKRTESEEKLPVIIFIHGGYWEEGNKDIYGFLGRNFARNNMVTVLANYRLSPNASYNDMAEDVLSAIRWTQNNIAAYGGDSEKIYLMGHSAGGHLIALVTNNPKYHVKDGTIKGVILNDAAGLDMKTYLEANPPTSKHNYNKTWTTNPENWKEASPVYFLDEQSPPFLMYVGKKTYPSIKSQNLSFLNELNRYQPQVDIIYLNKKHVAMMSQYFFPWSNRYDEISDFINKN